MRTNRENISFTYDALGNKWYKRVEKPDEKYGTAYLFGFQYSFKYNEVVKYDWKLMHIATSEGYVSAVYPQGINDGFKLHYVYNHTDHLGNIRQNITRKGKDIDILKEDNYYPFGLTHRGYNEQKEELQYDPEQDRIFTIQAQASRYRYQYNGKEWQEDVGVNWYDYGARNYDAAVGRWFNVDPLAEEYPAFSPYNYVMDNPVILRDLYGMKADSTFTLTESGEIKPLDGKVYDENGNEIDPDSDQPHYDKIKAEKTGEEMTVEEGVLQNREIIINKDNSKKVQIIETTGSEKGTELFMFMGRNMNNEIAIAFFDNRRNFLYTSFEHDRTLGIIPLILMNKGSLLNIHFHSHPNNDPDPSNEGGDTDAIKYLKHNRGHKNLRAYIYTPKDGKLHYYDENSGHQLNTIYIKINK